MGDICLSLLFCVQDRWCIPQAGYYLRVRVAQTMQKYEAHLKWAFQNINRSMSTLYQSVREVVMKDLHCTAHFFINRTLTLSLRPLKLRIDATRVWSENNTLKKLNTPVGILTKDQRSPNDSLKARPLARDRYHLISMTDINLLSTTDYL